MHIFNGLAAAAVAAVLSSPALAQATIEVAVPGPAGTLAGTLTLPAGDGPFPAAILISGSGRSDRDESLPGVPLRVFAQLAAELSAEGIAVLRYDDRGVGGSTGDFLSATSLDFADDAGAVLSFLAAHPAVDPESIGLIGHSEGGMIAPVVAAARPEDVAYVVSLAGTTVPGYDVLAGQLRHALSWLPEEQRAAIFAQEIRSLDLVRAQDWATLEAMLREEFAAMPAEQQVAVGPFDRFVAEGLTYYRGWLHTFITHDPAADWPQVKAPVLALFGGRDIQVTAALNVGPLESALAQHADATITTLETANHLFQDAVTGEPSEYATLPAAFVSGFSGTIATWIRDRVEPGGE